MKRVLGIVLVLVMISLTLFGCAAQTTTTTAATTTAATTTGATTTAATTATEPTSAGLSAVDFLTVDSAGPAVIPPVKAEGVSTTDALQGILSDDDIAMLKKGGYSIALSMHSMSMDYSRHIEAAIKAFAAEYGLKYLVTTDGQNDLTKQASDLESIITAGPDIIICQAIDPDGLNGIIQQALDAGIIMSFIDIAPSAVKFGEGNTAGFVTSDHYSQSNASMKLLLEKMPDDADIALIYWSYDVGAMIDRHQGVVDAIAEHPNMTYEIYRTQDEDEASVVMESVLAAKPELDGVWVDWDAACYSAATVAKNQGSKALFCTVGLDNSCAFNIASGGNIVTTTGLLPYEYGLTACYQSALKLLGHDTKAVSYVACPGVSVTKDNLEEAWGYVSRENPVLPDDIKAALGK